MNQSNPQKPKNSWRICAVFCPQAFVDSTTTVVNTLRLLEPLAEELFAITGNFPENAISEISGEKIHIANISLNSEDTSRYPILIRIYKFMVMQFKLSYNLVKIARKVDIVFLAAGAQALFLPALSAKLWRKKLIFLRLGAGPSFRKAEELQFERTLFGAGKYIFPFIVEFLEGFSCWLSDRIFVFLPDTDSPVLTKFRNKLAFNASRFYVDTNTFKVEKNLESRENLVGYIGRFEEVKGVMNFTRALPQLLRELSGVRVLIGGDGAQRDEIEKELRSANLGEQVTLLEWIPHDKLPEYLNQLKLIVIPSYSEVGPHLLFEAMACGTPVLAAPVGVMPGVIKDGETGFIMEDNSPPCIARNAVRALAHPHLSQIAKAARELMEREYTHEAAVARYRNILANLG